MLRMTSIFLTAVLLCSCSAHASRDPAPAVALAVPANSASTVANLDGTQWRFMKVAGASVPPKVTATLRFANGHASGKAGCNAYGAAYHVAADGSASFQQTLSTKMACLQPSGVMQIENGIFAAFRATARVEMRGGDNLVLLDASGQPLATLARTDTTSR
ncbi:MAG: META domain-containing protein [Rhodanobacteraceae bacterium]